MKQTGDFWYDFMILYPLFAVIGVIAFACMIVAVVRIIREPQRLRGLAELQRAENDNKAIGGEG